MKQLYFINNLYRDLETHNSNMNTVIWSCWHYAKYNFANFINQFVFKASKCLFDELPFDVDIPETMRKLISYKLRKIFWKLWRKTQNMFEYLQLSCKIVQHQLSTYWVLWKQFPGTFSCNVKSKNFITNYQK